MPDDVAAPEVQDQSPVEDTSVTDAGQGEATAPEGQAEPFFSYEHDDGEVLQWNSPDEVKKYIREGTLRHRDYTKKTQELSEHRKAIEAQRQKFDTEYQNFLQLKTQYDKYDQFLKQNPNIINELKQRMSQPKTELPPELQEKLAKIDEFEKKMQQEQTAKQRQAALEKAHEALSKEYSDYNKDSVAKLMQELEETPPGDEQRRYLELLYLASRGRENPAKIERRVAENLANKQRAHTPMGATAGAPSGKGRSFKDSNEALNAALQELA